MQSLRPVSWLVWPVIRPTAARASAASRPGRSSPRAARWGQQCRWVGTLLVRCLRSNRTVRAAAGPGLHPPAAASRPIGAFFSADARGVQVQVRRVRLCGPAALCRCVPSPDRHRPSGLRARRASERPAASRRRWAGDRGDRFCGIRRAFTAMTRTLSRRISWLSMPTRLSVWRRYLGRATPLLPPIQAAEQRFLAATAQAVAAISDRLLTGDCYQVNLCRTLRAKLPTSSIVPAYLRLRGCAPAPLCCFPTTRRRRRAVPDEPNSAIEHT